MRKIHVPYWNIPVAAAHGGQSGVLCILYYRFRPHWTERTDRWAEDGQADSGCLATAGRTGGQMGGIPRMAETILNNTVTTQQFSAIFTEISQTHCVFCAFTSSRSASTGFHSANDTGAKKETSESNTVFFFILFSKQATAQVLSLY